MIIAGIDPGLTTGVALVVWDGVNPPLPPEQEAHQVEFTELPAFMRTLVPRVDLLVVERFFISARTVKASRQYEALYAIGGILFLADEYDKPVRLQAASDAKTAYTNETLKSLGWKPKGRHAKDALRHALLATHSRTLYSQVTDKIKGTT